jgi:hypothetical protein
LIGPVIIVNIQQPDVQGVVGYMFGGYGIWRYANGNINTVLLQQINVLLGLITSRGNETYR